MRVGLQIQDTGYRIQDAPARPAREKDVAMVGCYYNVLRVDIPKSYLRKAPDGFANWTPEKQHDWYVAAKASAWHSRNPESNRLRVSQWQKNNPEKVAARNRRYRERNAEAIKKRAAARRRTRREKINAYQRARHASDPAYALRMNLACRMRNALKTKGAPKNHTTKRYLGCSIAHLRQHLESQFDEKMSWSNYGSYWVVDHIIPCAAFDLLDEQQCLECFHFTNLQPLECSENLRKGAKMPDELN